MIIINLAHNITINKIMTDSTSIQIGKNQDHLSLDKFAFFKDYLIHNCKLDAIRTYLPEMSKKTFFLLAGTGLGKTVVVPIHSWLEIFNRVKYCRIYNYNHIGLPKVFVIVPTITIAEEQVKFLNDIMFKKYCELHNYNGGNLFGCKTAKGSINNDAPIQFLTTGVFEAMATNSSFLPLVHTILIDEAHKTLETSTNFEIALTNAKYKGVRIDYMSATVNTDGLQKRLGFDKFIIADNIRHPIYKKNTKKNMVSSIVDVVDKCLINFDIQSEYIPQDLFMDRDFKNELINSWRTTPRPSAMLAIVNSKKEIAEITRIINDNFPGFPVLQFSSAIKKDNQQFEKFQNTIINCTKQLQNYLIVSTNVVEMGVTFDNLDWVITKDQEYTNTEASLELTPLRVNALYQRLGRVGRKGVGIGLITNDGGSYYSSLDDVELNTLTCESINFPLENASLQTIAINSFHLKWSNEQFIEELTKWHCPSLIHQNQYKLEKIMQIREIMRDYQIINNDSLNNHGKNLHVLMYYSGFSFQLSIKLYSAYVNKDWELFSYLLAISIVEKFSLTELGENRTNQLIPFYQNNLNEKSLILRDYYSPEMDDDESKLISPVKINHNSTIAELYEFFVKLNRSDIPSDSIFQFGFENNYASHAQTSSVELNFRNARYNGNSDKLIKTLEKFNLEVTTLANTVYSAFLKFDFMHKIPIFTINKQSKNNAVTKVKLLSCSDEYDLPISSNWKLTKLTGKARHFLGLSKLENGSYVSNYEYFSIPEVVVSIKPSKNLQFEFKVIETNQTGWVSPITFHQILKKSSNLNNSFYTIISKVVKQDETIEYEVLHYVNTPVKNSKNIDLSDYFPKKVLLVEDEDIIYAQYLKKN